MYYKSVIIHKNRIFAYFENKGNLHKYNNNLLTMMIIIG